MKRRDLIRALGVGMWAASCPKLRALASDVAGSIPAANRNTGEDSATFDVAGNEPASALSAKAQWVTPISRQQKAVFTVPPQQVPTRAMPDGPLLGNGDVGVVLAGPPEAQIFYIGKNDFWRRSDASVEAVGNLTLATPALQGASYRQEQDMANAEVRGTFTTDGTTIRTRSWVDANENLLVTALQCAGSQPVEVSLSQSVGDSGGRVLMAVADNDRAATIGRELHGGGRWYFDGSIADLNITPNFLSADEIRVLAGKPAKAATAKVFDGHSVFEEQPVPKVSKAVSVSAWIKIGSVSEANYVVSKGDWDQAYSLGLSGGHLRWAINGTFVETKQPLELHQWTHVAGTFDGRRLCAFVDGILKAQLGDDASGGTIDEKSGTICFIRKADETPKPREVAVVSRFIGATAHGKDGVLTVMLQPGREVFVVSSVQTDLDATNFQAAAQALVRDLSRADIVKLSASHRGWWKKFWARSFIDIPDKEIERRWYAALYVMGSCSRAGKVAPGLWGNWVTTDHPKWHGDFHLNYNFQAPFYIVYSANHADLSLPFYQTIWESVPNGRAMAQRHGWKGIHFPVSIGPWGLCPESPDGDLGQRSNAAGVALNFIWQYQYTQDTNFLRATAYPYLREVADFWENYLKFENGRYVDQNDAIQEDHYPTDVNPILTLGLLRTLFQNMIPMSETLGIDAGRRAKWQDILDRLSPFPTQERNGKVVFRYTEKGLAWYDDNTLGIQHIFPAGAIGFDSDPKLLEVSRNTIDEMHRWTDNNGFASWYTACARVGYDPKTILAKLRAECDQRSFPNLLLYYSGGGIENCSGFLAINEMLLQSHEGVLRFFPCWPKDQDARFGNLRAVGAFLVSAELKDGVVDGVKIVSEKGRDCTVQSPWPSQAL